MFTNLYYKKTAAGLMLLAIAGFATQTEATEAAVKATPPEPDYKLLSTLPTEVLPEGSQLQIRKRKKEKSLIEQHKDFFKKIAELKDKKIQYFAVLNVNGEQVISNNSSDVGLVKMLAGATERRPDLGPLLVAGGLMGKFEDIAGIEIMGMDIGRRKG